MKQVCSLFAASLLAASALSAQPVPPVRDAAFCADLSRTVSAVERGRVTALEASRAASPRFGFTQPCAAQGAGWFCHQALAPPSLSFRNLVEQVSACSPEATRTLASGHSEAIFLIGGVRLRIAESGAPGAHVGRIVTLAIEPR